MNRPGSKLDPSPSERPHRTPVSSYDPAALSYGWSTEVGAFTHQLDRDLQLLVIWSEGREREAEVLDLVAADFTILARIEVRWSAAKMVNNFERLYGQTLWGTSPSTRRSGTDRSSCWSWRTAPRPIHTGRMSRATSSSPTSTSPGSRPPPGAHGRLPHPLEQQRPRVLPRRDPDPRARAGGRDPRAGHPGDGKHRARAGPRRQPRLGEPRPGIPDRAVDLAVRGPAQLRGAPRCARGRPRDRRALRRPDGLRRSPERHRGVRGTGGCAVPHPGRGRGCLLRHPARGRRLPRHRVAARDPRTTGMAG
ncbi:hypothetical protein NKG05_19725 [Oerskovia sp. M15]